MKFKSKRNSNSLGQRSQHEEDKGCQQKDGKKDWTKDTTTQSNDLQGNAACLAAAKDLSQWNKLQGGAQLKKRWLAI